MAGEIKLNNVSIATENAGTVTIAPNNVQFAANHAGIKTALNASGSAPVYACRAWVNFNGTGTVAIRNSGNVSSLTDNGTGNYTVNFATAMPHNNYVITGAGTATNLQSPRIFTLRDSDLRSTSQLQITYQRYDGLLSDQSYCFLAIFC